MTNLRDQSHIGEARNRYSHWLFEPYSEALVVAGRRALLLNTAKAYAWLAAHPSLETGVNQ